MKDIVKRYGNGEITVVWRPSACIHSARCFRGLPEVFDPRARPWVNIGGATSAAIVEQVGRCPSGALSIAPPTPEATAAAGDEPGETRIQPLPNGPLVVHGEIVVERADGAAERRHESTAFCRCGGSANKPYCDGTHLRNGFRG